MNTCFVIQPFDNDRFDKRYDDTYKRAIEEAGVVPYRIDKDLAVRIPIDQIEEGITKSILCFADITKDNPNVWYELGYAFARGKDVIMVCSDERVGQFPFDIRHRHIISYKTSSKSDFEILETTITEKIKAILHNSKTIATLNATPVVDQEGLSAHEIAIIIIIAEGELNNEGCIATFHLRDQMMKAGYTDIATSMGLKTLGRKKMIETVIESDWNNNTYTGYQLTEKGDDWLLSNQDKLIFRKEVNQNVPKNNQPDDDDLPF